jgi:hypothetical protein
MHRNKKLVPKEKPLTPAVTLSPLPKGFSFEPQQPISIKEQEILYRMYLREKARADRLLKELKFEKADKKARRQWARTSRLTKLKPTGLDRPAKRGKL